MKFLTTTALIFTCLCLQAQTDNLKKHYVEYQVNVSPNPSDGPIKIDAPTGATCKVVSFSGNYIGSWQINEEGLTIENLRPGKYIVKTNYKGSETTKKVVIL